MTLLWQWVDDLERFFGVRTLPALSALLVAGLLVLLALLLWVKHWRDGRDLRLARIGAFHGEDPFSQPDPRRRRRRGRDEGPSRPDRHSALWSEPWVPSLRSEPPMPSGRPAPSIDPATGAPTGGFAALRRSELPGPGPAPPVRNPFLKAAPPAGAQADDGADPAGPTPSDRRPPG